MQIIWRPSAIEDSKRVRAFIGKNNSKAARRVSLAIEETSDSLADFPERGRPGRVQGTREVLVTGTPYLIAYVVGGDVVTILAIVHHAQRWPDIL
jgi:toxin ParE1/3/4